MLVNTYNQQGEKLKKKTRLPKKIFGLDFNSDLVHQVVSAQRQNRRQASVQVKERAEVRGGGRKPWRQKGTGRARHGSIRSPIWRGGGVTFGPTKEREFKRKINKKMKRKALFMVLSSKVKDQELIVLDNLKLTRPKTKQVAAILNNLSLDDTCLIAQADNKLLVRAARNLPQVKTMEARNLNALDLLRFKYLIIPKKAIKVIKETFTRD